MMSLAEVPQQSRFILVTMVRKGSGARWFDIPEGMARLGGSDLVKDEVERIHRVAIQLVATDPSGAPDWDALTPSFLHRAQSLKDLARAIQQLPHTIHSALPRSFDSVFSLPAGWRVPVRQIFSDFEGRSGIHTPLAIVAELAILRHQRNRDLVPA